MVIAIERAQGAELDDDRSAASQRTNEAYRWAEEAAAEFIACSAKTSAFADALDGYRSATNQRPFRLRVQAAARPTSLLPIRRLEDMGFQPTPARTLLPFDLNVAQPVPEFIKALREFARNDLDYGQFLRVSAQQRLLLEGEPEIA